METRFTILLIEIGIAVAIQCAVLIAILVTVQKSSSKMSKLAEELHQRTLPILEGTNAIVQTSKPQVELIVANLAETSTILKDQAVKIEDTFGDIIDRTRLQVVRVDELVSRTLNRVETTSEFVEHTVVSPVRQVSGVLQALSTGFGVLFGRRSHSRNGDRVAVPKDEMFI